MESEIELVFLLHSPCPIMLTKCMRSALHGSDAFHRMFTLNIPLSLTNNLQPIIAIWFNVEPILLALNQKPEVARIASIYLRWGTLGLPAYSFNLISRYIVKSRLCDIRAKGSLACVDDIFSLKACFKFQRKS